MVSEYDVNDMLVVKQSCIHNKGVFAKRQIPADTKLIEYVGKIVTNAEADRIHAECIAKIKDGDSAKTYLFELDDEHYIDGDVPENHAKFINHSCNPNAEYRYDDGSIWIVSRRDVADGEEITYNYGFELDEEFMEHPCCCGSENCVGYILHEEYWPRLKEVISRSTKV